MSTFRVFATVPNGEPYMGKADLEAKTLKDALEKARELRGQKLSVVIKGPDGQIVDEAAIDEDDL